SASGAPDRFGLLLAGSLGFLVALQAILHVAVDLVLLPPTGMGLPFVSAGGTSLILVAAATGLIVSVTARSKRPGRIATP
ncbi:MAG: FtsW/RodA/SpoVE family cell cycle protein, partial [Planctomycetota bacterium]